MSADDDRTGTAETTGHSITIRIADTGIDIPEENMDNLFEPLFTTKAKGKCIGLPVCKRFIESHGDTITVESEEGKSSTFTISIPVTDTP